MFNSQIYNYYYHTDILITYIITITTITCIIIEIFFENMYLYRNDTQTQSLML